MTKQNIYFPVSKLQKLLFLNLLYCLCLLVVLDQYCQILTIYVSSSVIAAELYPNW